MPKGRVRGPAISTHIRSAFVRAIARLDDKGVDLADIVEECLMEKPLETFKALSAYSEKDINVGVDGDIKISWTLQSPTNPDPNSSISTSKLPDIDSLSPYVTDDGVKQLPQSTNSSKPS